MSRDITTLSRALPHARGYAFAPVSIGRSGSAVYRLTAPQNPTLYLKVSPIASAAELQAEHDRLQWLAGKAPVPGVLDFAVAENAAYLLTEALPGRNATETPTRSWPHVVAQLATELRRLHALDPQDCPFDRTLERVIPEAHARAMAGMVDESDFDAERLGLKAVDLLDALERERPQSEDLVVTHGDACLPNAIFDDERFSGFIDWGRCGRADRYQDLALAVRSIEGNFTAGLDATFLEAYGVERVDSDKLAYYQLLDEFF